MTYDTPDIDPMTMLSIWREQLKRDLATFAPLVNEDRSINLIYGITAAAVLWSVRAAPFSDAHRAALNEACGDEKHMPHLLTALGEWDDIAPLEAARKLSTHQRDSEELRKALTIVMGYFIEELVSAKMVQTQNIAIDGNITGGNIIIGGHQIVAGDLIIQHIAPKAERMCPAPAPEPERFGGRDVSLSEIMDFIKAGKDTAITAVQGLGGIGKTTLARVLAHRLHADKTFRAVLWADVTRNPNAINILSGWAVSYADSSFNVANFNGNSGQIADAVRVQLNDVITEKCETCDPPRVLVVLDDVWDNGRDAARLIKRACPDHATLLITTRSENVAIDLSANVQSLAYLTPDEAVDFLKTYLTGSDEPLLMRLGTALGGHALALELAARRILKEKRPNESDAVKLARLTTEYEHGVPAGSSFAQLKLEQGEKKADNLTRSLYQSYEILTPVEQKRFRALGILAYDATFSAEMLSALWELPLEQVYEAADALRLLSLLDLDAGGYAQHPLLRAYARALLDEQGEKSEAFDHYADYVIAQAEQFDTLPPEQLGQLAFLQPHVEAVGDALVEHYTGVDTPDETLQTRMSDFAYNVSSYFYYRPQVVTTQDGRRLRGMNWLESGRLASQRQGNQSRESFFINQLALAWSSLGEKRKAIDFYAQVLPLNRSIGDESNEATTLHNLGSVWSDLGEKHKALELYQQALSLRRKTGDQYGEAATLHNIGSVWNALGETRKALEFYQLVLPLRRAVGDIHGEAMTLNNIGYAWSVLSEQLKALDYYGQALRIMRAIGDQRAEAAVLNNIGGVRSQLGEPSNALAFYEQALALSRAVGDRGSEANMLNNIGGAWEALGKTRIALDFYQQALSLNREVEDRNGEAATLHNIGSAWATLGETQIALNLYEQARTLSRDVGDRVKEATMLHDIGHAWSSLGEKRRALDFYQKALALSREVENRTGAAASLNNIGSIWEELGQKRKALYFYQQSLSLSREVGDRRGEAATLHNIGNTWSEMRKKRKALDSYQKALPLFHAVGDLRGEGYTLSNMSYIYESIDDLNNALRCAEHSAKLLESIEDVKAPSSRRNFERLKAKRDAD